MNSDYNRAYLEAVDKGLGILRTDDIEYSSSQAVGLSIPIGELKRLKRLIANIEEAKGRANITYDAKKFLENFRFPSPATYPDNYRIYTDHNGKQRLYIKMRSFSDPNMLTLEKFKGIKWKTYNSALRKCFLIFSVLILLVAMGLVAYDIKVSYSEQLDAYNRDQLKLIENAEQLLKNKKHDNRNDLCNLLEKYSSLKNDVSKNHFIYFKLPILKFDLCDGFLMSEKKLIDNISYSDDLKKLLQGLRKDFFKNFQEIINLMKKLRSMNATYTNNLINIYKDEYVKTLHDILNDYLKSNSLSDFRKFQDLMNNEDNRKFIGKDKINKILNSDSYKALLKLLEKDTSKSKYEGLSLEIGKLLKDNNIIDAYSKTKKFKTDEYNRKDVESLTQDIIERARKYIDNIVEKELKEPCKGKINQIVSKLKPFSSEGLLDKMGTPLSDLEKEITIKYHSYVNSLAHRKIDAVIKEVTDPSGNLEEGKEELLVKCIKETAEWANNVSDKETLLVVDNILKYLQDLKISYSMTIDISLPSKKSGFLIWGKELSSKIELCFNNKFRKIYECKEKHIDIENNEKKEWYDYSCEISDILPYVDIYGENLNTLLVDLRRCGNSSAPSGPSDSYKSIIIPLVQLPLGEHKYTLFRFDTKADPSYDAKIYAYIKKTQKVENASRKIGRSFKDLVKTVEDYTRKTSAL